MGSKIPILQSIVWSCDLTRVTQHYGMEPESQIWFIHMFIQPIFLSSNCMSGSLLNIGEAGWTGQIGPCPQGTYSFKGETDKGNVNKLGCYTKKMGSWYEEKRDLLWKKVTFLLRSERGAEEERSKQKDLCGSRTRAGKSFRNWKKWPSDDPCPDVRLPLHLHLVPPSHRAPAKMGFPGGSSSPPRTLLPEPAPCTSRPLSGTLFRIHIYFQLASSNSWFRP